MSVASVAVSAAMAAMEVAQTPKQAVSLATRPRSLPSQQAEAEAASRWRGRRLMAALPPYRAAVLVRQFLAVRQPAALSPYQVLRLVVPAEAPSTSDVSGNGASVSLISNGGVNDAIGGATSGTLNLTQTAIGGNSGSVARAALVAVHPAHLLELIPSDPQPIISMPMQLAGMACRVGGSATATADASASKAV